jgi:hypothetical protein
MASGPHRAGRGRHWREDALIDRPMPIIQIRIVPGIPSGSRATARLDVPGRTATLEFQPCDNFDGVHWVRVRDLPPGTGPLLAYWASQKATFTLGCTVLGPPGWPRTIILRDCIDVLIAKTSAGTADLLAHWRPPTE